MNLASQLLTGDIFHDRIILDLTSMISENSYKYISSKNEIFSHQEICKTVESIQDALNAPEAQIEGFRRMICRHRDKTRVSYISADKVISYEIGGKYE